MNNRIEFDYSKLSQGYKAVTRSGVYPTEVHRFETAESACTIVAVINGDYKLFTDAGEQGTIGGESDLDLFLEPPVRVEWWNVSVTDSGFYKYQTLNDALHQIKVIKDFHDANMHYTPVYVTLKATYHGDDKEPVSVELVKIEE